MSTSERAGWMKDEHAKVAEAADRLREVTASAPRGDRAEWLARLRTRFDDYASHLREHLAQEEEGGYLTHVVELRPTLSEAVEIIRQEHEELTHIIQDVQAAVHELAPEDNLLRRDCCERVKQLMFWIERHEEHENYIVTYAFTQDLGTPH